MGFINSLKATPSEALSKKLRLKRGSSIGTLIFLPFSTMVPAVFDQSARASFKGLLLSAVTLLPFVFLAS